MERQRLKGVDSCPAETTRRKKLICRLIPFKWDKNAIEKWLDENPIPNQSRLFSSSAPTMPLALQKTLTKFGHTSYQSDAEFRERMQRGFIKESEFIREHFADKNYSLNYSHFIIPESGWTMVRPHEYERKLDQNWKYEKKLRLPAVPSEMLFYIDKNNVCAWKMPADLINDNGVKVLAEDQRLLAHQKELIHLIYILAKNYDPLDLDVRKILRDPSFYGFNEEQKMLEIFDQRKKSRIMENKNYCSNYLLLDPREFKTTKVHEDVPFHEFIQSIFYIGKTSTEKDRPFSHLNKTFNRNEKEILKKYGVSFKRNRIRQIWEAGHGVIVHLIYTNIDEQEALFREVTMIRARMGKNNFLREFIKQPNKNAQIQFNKEINEYWQNTILGPIDLTNKKDELDQKKRAMYLDWGNSGPIDLTNEKDELGKEKAMCLDGYNSTIDTLGSRLLLRAFGIFRLERHEEIFETAFKFKKPAKRRHSSSESQSMDFSSQFSDQSISSPSQNSAQSIHSSPSQRSAPTSSSRPSKSPMSAGQTTLDSIIRKEKK